MPPQHAKATKQTWHKLLSVQGVFSKVNFLYYLPRVSWDAPSACMVNKALFRWLLISAMGVLSTPLLLTTSDTRCPHTPVTLRDRKASSNFSTDVWLTSFTRWPGLVSMATMSVVTIFCPTDNIKQDDCFLETDFPGGKKVRKNAIFKTKIKVKVLRFFTLVLIETVLFVEYTC